MNLNFQDLHPIQGHILRELLFHPQLKFSKLNTGNIPSDQFSFHIKRLSDLGLISKSDDHYELTILGKEFTNRFDAESNKMILERQAKIGALVVCAKKSDHSIHYLIQQRLKQPYYGFYGMITGKVKWGETIQETATRELKEETNLEADLSLAGIEHKIDYSQNGSLLEDKYFFIFRGENPRGTLTESFEGGRNAWITMDEILKLPDLFPDVPEVIEVIDRKKFQLFERKFTVDRY